MSRNSEYIGAKGGNVVAQFFLDTTTNTMVTASLVQGTNCMDLGHLANSNVALTPSVSKFPSEDGIVRRTSTTWEGTIDGQAMETSEAFANWFGYTTRGQVLINYKLQGRKNGKWQEIWAIGENENGFAFAAPDSGTGSPFKVNITPRDTAVTLTTTQIGLMRSALQITQGGVNRAVLYPYYTGVLTLAAEVEFEITET